MKTLTEIDNTIDALKDVSTNALSKHGYSRSRQRLVDLSVNLQQAWENYKVIHGKTYYKELCLFVICRSSSGLRYNTIAKRTGLNKVVVHDCLSLLLADKLIYKKLNDKRLLYCAKKK
jgi:hypothetical protein